MTDEDAIPAFCVIPAAIRAAAWIKNPPRPMPKFADVRREEEPATKELRAQMAMRDARKKAEGLESLRAWKETQRAAEGFTPKAPKLFHKRAARVPKKPQRKRRVSPK